MKKNELFYKKESKTHGLGLFAKRDIKPGELIFISRGIKTLNRSISIEDAEKVYSNGISIDEAITFIPLPLDPLNFLNHSCSPNVYIKNENEFFAIKNIKKDQEMFMDYSFSDADLFWRMHNCNCLEKSCRKTITSSILLSRDVFIKNIKYIPNKIINFNKKFYGE